MSPESITDPQIDEIRMLGIGEIHDSVKHLTATLYGEEFTQLPSTVESLEERIQRGHAFLHNPDRKAAHKVFGLVMASVGMPASSLAATWISLMSGQEGVRKHQVQMVGQEMMVVDKVQTMRTGAHDERRSPFEHTSFIAHRLEDQNDSRILPVPGIKTIRKTGVDDLKQTKLVVQGKMDITGVRFYSPEELKGIMLLSQMTDKQYEQAGIGKELAWIYRQTPHIMRFTQPRHAGINMRSTLGNGRSDFWTFVHHGVRQWTDVLFVLNATARTEWQMVKSFLKVRAIKGAVQGLQHAARVK